MTSHPNPGTITIGWHDDLIPCDAPLTLRQLLSTQELRRAIAHLAVDIGAKPARRAAWMLARRLRRLAAQAAKRGEYLQLQTRNQTTAPAPYDAHHGLGLEVRAIRDHLIRWDIALYSQEGFCRQFAYTYRVISAGASSGTFRSAPDAATLIRHATRHFPIGYTAAGKAVWSSQGATP